MVDIEHTAWMWSRLSRWDQMEVAIYALLLRYKGKNWQTLKIAGCLAVVAWIEFEVFIEIKTGVLL